MKDILITEEITGPDIDTLKRTFQVTYEPALWKSPDKIRELVADHRAIMVRNQTQVNADVIAAGKKLEVIGRWGVGLDNVDTKAATAAGIPIVYAPEQNSISVAELAIGMMISLSRMLNAADRSTKSGKWERKKFTGSELFNKTLGIVGLGRIGFLTAMRARAFGMDIIAHDTFVNPDSLIVSETRAQLVSLDELLSRSDFISCHLPETPQTANIFNADRFAKMKPTAFFINTSRGGVVDESALLNALKSKKIAGAALDVRAKEPPQIGELETLDNVLLLPHIAAFTTEGQDRVMTCVCNDVTAVLKGQPAKNFFNFPLPRR